MYRKYYSYNDMPKPILPVPVDKTAEKAEKLEKVTKEVKKPLGLPFEKDDLILIAVLFTLILNGCDDKLLIIAIAALLIM